MLKITLKNGSVKDVDSGTTLFEIAKNLGGSLYKEVCVARVDGELKDLKYSVKKDCSVEFLTFDSEDGKKTYWHTTSHIMAQAVCRLYPGTKFAIGPAIAEGFYYDFDFEKSINDDDLKKIEEEMQKIVKENLSIELFTMEENEAVKFMQERNQPYKIELIEKHKNDGELIFRKQGEFVDLCGGTHMMSTGYIKSFKLIGYSGAYWKGDSKNKMLTRIYGISFPKKSMLEEYLQILEDRKSRDHRKICKDLKLFMTHPLVGSGLPIYLPGGATIRRILERYIQDKELELGYNHVYTPSLASTGLYKISGHWDHYKDDMFPVMEMENEEMVLRPMNCPHHMLIYKNELHSYRDLPIRIGELAHDFRYENSGAVCGLERVRQMCQNDAHIFVRPDQIKEEIGNVLRLIFSVWKTDFGFDRFEVRLSLRDKENKEKYIDNDEMWDTAESQLREILTELKIDFYEAKGEAAFYGPKIDIQIKSALMHDVTIPTCQLDFALPERFDLTYIGKDGNEHRPVVIHRAVLGSSDRFIAFLLEETKGNLPLWLAPEQIRILPISENFMDYAESVDKKLKELGKFRISIDSKNEKIGKKIREAQLNKVPYMLILGQKEVENNVISVRSRDKGDLGSISLEDFVENLKIEIKNKR